MIACLNKEIVDNILKLEKILCIKYYHKIKFDISINTENKY